MKNKKHIDKFFGNDFQNFEAEPSPRVWENIQNELNKKKRERNIIPLWVKYGGIAALLALFFTVGNFIYNPSEDIQDSVTTETNKNPEKEKYNNTIIDQNLEINKSRVVVENSNSSEFIDPSGSSENPNIKSSKKSKSTTSPKYSDVIASEEQNKAQQGNKNRDPFINKNKQEQIEPHKDVAISQEEINISNKGKEIENESKNQVVDSDKILSLKNKDKIAIVDNLAKTQTDSIGNILAEQSENKKSILDAIADSKIENEDLADKKNSKSNNRWIVTPNVAPVYYSSLSNGSSIDQDFANNPQKGDVNMSYGLQVSYALNDRLSIRSGINNMDLSYSTTDIVIGMGPVSAALKSVDYGSKQVVITAISRASLDRNHSSNEYGDITLKSTSGDAQLIQSMNYYEIPLELKYAVVDSKFGINLIGGVSTLFLGNNEISVKSDNFSSVLGEANNLSNVSFSTNVGVGLDYKLSKRFVFNIEPMFKYQLNPYTDSTVNFKPYYLGVYSGLSFKF